MNNESSIVSFEEIWSEIKKAYDPTFIEKLIAIPNAHVYAFGGIVYDLSLGKQWKDLDLRVILDLPQAERDKAVMDVLTKYTDVVQTFEFPEGTVIRVKVPTGKNMIIDVGAANTFDKFRSDFTACSIFMDLKTGEAVEIGKDCIKDFENKIIKPLDEPRQQLENDPSHLFRALKFSAKTGFVIDPEFAEVLKEKKNLIQKAVTGVTSYLEQNGKDSISEYFLGNLFGGLKAHPDAYVDLLREYGFLEEMGKALQGVVQTQDKEVEFGEGSGQMFEGLTIFEDKLSMFLTILAKAISNEPSYCFEKIKKAFALDTSRSDGNEFVVDPEKIRFIA